MVFSYLEFYLNHMQKAKLFILLISLLSSVDAYAHQPEMGVVWATLGPNVYRTIPRHKIFDQESPYLSGGGLVAEGDLDENGGVEIAMIYFDKVYLRERYDDYTSEQIKRMFITTGYRHWFNDHLSAALAFYSSYSMGDVKTRHSELPSDTDLTTTASKITEYGMDLSVQWELWNNGEMGVVADARYAWAITRLPHEDSDVYSLLLGFKYLIPKRGKE